MPYELTPEQLARDRRMMNNLWIVLDNAPEKIVEFVQPPDNAVESQPIGKTQAKNEDNKIN